MHPDSCAATPKPPPEDADYYLVLNHRRQPLDSSGRGDHASPIPRFEYRSSAEHFACQHTRGNRVLTVVKVTPLATYEETRSLDVTFHTKE